MADIPLSWKTGIDHVSKETNLPHGAVRDAVNVDIDRAGTVDLRDGYTLLAAGNAHSLWTSPATGRSFCVVNGVLKELTYDGSTLSMGTLATLAADQPVSYDDLNGEVVAGTMTELLAIGTSARALGVEDPSPPAVTAVTGVGGLDPGRYGVLCTFLRGAEESAASDAVYVDVAADGGLDVVMPTPTGGDVTLVRIYRTQANGNVFYRASDRVPSSYSLIIGAGNVGRQLDTAYMQRLPGGQIVRAWRGRLLVARGSNLLFSRSMRYGLYDPTEDFVQFAHRITLMQPVEGGVFVGTKDGVVFLSGDSPDAWQVRPTGGMRAVEGSGTSVPTSILGGERDYGGKNAALWLAQNGFVIGTADGSLVEPQSKRISLPDSQVAAGVGASVVHERRVLTSIN